MIYISITVVSGSIMTGIIRRSVTRAGNSFTRRLSSSFVCRTKPLHEKIIIKVPTMGDSISEGTIVEWAVAVGQAVKVDDLVALVETDKVTVDMKASLDGVITQHFAKVDDTIEVGAPLYEIDTEAAPSIDWTGCASTVGMNEEEPNKEGLVSTVVASEESKVSSSGRKPSIQFLGKEGWKKKLSAEGMITPKLPSKPEPPMKPFGAVVLNGSNIQTSSYGRKIISQKEMDAFILGGANTAPGFSD